MKHLVVLLFFTTACETGVHFEYLNVDEEVSFRLDCALDVVDQETANFSANGIIEVVGYRDILGYWQIDRDNGRHGDMYIKLATGDSPSVQALSRGLTSLAGYVYDKDLVMERVFQECP